MALGTGRKQVSEARRPCAARGLCLAAILLALGASALQQADAIGDTRTIALHHVHTKEDITLTYKRNGRYDEAALAKINHFMRDWRKNEQVKIDPQLVDLLWEIHREVGAKAPIHVVCGYRSPETNAMLRARSNGVALFSQHMNGNAIDFFIPGVPIEDVRTAALRLQGGGVGYYPQSGSRFVHVDVGSVRHWPRMSREELVRIFPNQRTLHIPSDGQPLAGYALALADLERGIRPSPPPKLAAVARLAGENESARAAQPAMLRQASLVAPPVVKTPPLPQARPAVLEVGKLPARPGSKTVGVSPSAVGDIFSPWPTAQVDRVPPELALAYAASNAPAPRVPLQNVQRAALLVPPARAPAIPAAAARDITGAVPRANSSRSLHNPWMRAVVLAPSVYFMTATQFNRPDMRELAPLMHMPRSVMAMTFSSDPYDGMTFHAFTGKAVQFIATVSFEMRTASLH